jgi:hypothetical protein
MFDDGDLYGIVDTHSHVHSNYAFGGGGLFHGGAYHRLGVEHALHDCSISHGEMGRKDFFGYIFDQTGNDQADISSLIPDLVAKQLAVDNHATAGYPDFTEWPNGPGARPTRPSTTCGCSGPTSPACAWRSCTRPPTRSSATS